MASMFSADEALAAAREGADGVYAVLLEHGTLEIGYYAPVGKDAQTPHAQDEVYVIRSGAGFFRVDGKSRPCRAGDALFVAAGVPHNFHDFSEGFAAWVIFYGPEGGERT
jgi:mannose-6-phosphate isomerase-like protein (cupin superfamily)